MIETPCEEMKWEGLPIIRKELVKSMINDFGLNQKEAADKLHLTPAAVCQYLSRKRGRISIIEEEMLTEINVSAGKIIEYGEKIVIKEICRLCKVMRKHGIQCFSIYK
jgi:predicted transcriptional regulator